MTHVLLAVIYLAFISLGLPDAILGAVWPIMYQQFQVPISYAGLVSIVICIGTVFASLRSDHLTKRFGTGKVTTASVALTAFALFGFSISNSFWMLMWWAIPYGLGAGAIDAALNNYVALHYRSSHMNWLHSMWGVGAMTGPYLSGYLLTCGLNWSYSYLAIGSLQIGLCLILFGSLPLWARTNQALASTDTATDPSVKSPRPLPLKTVINIPGAKAIFICFFAYCGLESTTGLWASSFLKLERGFSAEDAASYGALFFVGITLGRMASGFFAYRLTDNQLIKIGLSLVALGLFALFFPYSNWLSLFGLVITGCGAAPIYPSIIHSTPQRFGPENSQALIGIQMASAYVGSLILPPIFGLLANHISIACLPFYQLLLLLFMLGSFYSVQKVGVKQ